MREVFDMNTKQTFVKDFKQTQVIFIDMCESSGG